MKSITSLSLIKGVFRELAALRKPVQVRGKHIETSSTILIVDDFSRFDTQNNVIRFGDAEVTEPEIELSFEMDGHYYGCQIKAHPSATGDYCLPNTIQSQQRRKRSRSDLQSLSRQPIVLEVRGPLWRAYGYLKDSDRGYFTAKVSCFGATPKVTDAVRVRAYTAETQVLAASARIREVRQQDDKSQVEILLDPYDVEQRAKKDREDRRELSSITHLEVHWPDTDGLRIRVAVFDVTSTGFSAKAIGDQKEFPPRGAVCKIGNSEITAQLQWQKENHIGFDLSQNDRNALSLWSNWIDEWQLKVLNRTPTTRQQKKIASVLIRSGYLRDFKASAFSSTPDLLSLIPNNQSTRTWIRRYVRGIESDLDAHVSFARCADCSWIIQELGSSAVNSKVGETLLLESIESFQAQEAPYLTYGETLLALYDPLSKFNQKFWIEREHLEGISAYEARLVQIRPALEHHSKTENQPQDIQIKQPSIETWPEAWSTLKSWLPERALYGLGLRSDDFSSPNLRQTLAQSGYFLERSVSLIYEGGDLIGLGMTMGVPTFSNLNATSNHIWIALRDTKKWSQALAALLRLEGLRSLLGATEAVVFSPSITSNDLEESGFHATFTRRRRLNFIPTYKLDKFLHSRRLA